MVAARENQQIDYFCLGLTSSRDQRQYRNLKFLVQEEAQAVRMRRKSPDLRPSSLKEDTAAAWGHRTAWP